ncbi:unnamed protein product [Rotaria sordida]|uniref:F-box domain-containing protein n=1 Tax=Rotaria sordida TaxID=392033 RepID=A0A819XXI7_9BILA|nr:unnamed protein product [Rotaria sordida]CAF4146204.1 unnamed protein product [Rotaria sordida]
MNNYLSQFELLPNEILIELFQYFNAQDLFQAFINLNIRFNRLIQSFHNLKLVFYLKQSNKNLITNNHIFSLYVYTLIVDSNVDINLNQFSNIHRLKFEWFSTKQLQQLSTNIFPYLEELNLIYIETLSTNHKSLFLPSLRILKVRFINLSIYQTILSSCPNLYYFQLSIFTSEEYLFNIQTHNKLKKLIIRISDVIWPWNDHLFNCYLSSVPNLEQFNIHRLLYISRITESFINYNWFASIISIHLQKLQHFYFYLRTSQSKYINKINTEKILNQLNETFLKVHNDQYQSRLIIECS